MIILLYLAVILIFAIDALIPTLIAWVFITLFQVEGISFIFTWFIFTIMDMLFWTLDL